MKYARSGCGVFEGDSTSTTPTRRLDLTDAEKAANVAAVQAAHDHVDTVIRDLLQAVDHVDRTYRENVLQAVVRGWDSIPVKDARWLAAHVLLGREWSRDTDSAVLMDIRDSVILLLEGINDAACDRDDCDGPGVRAETAAKLAFAARQITSGAAVIEDGSYEAFAASRGVIVDGAR